MKLNPLNCTFGVSAGKFLVLIIHERGIEVNLDKITSLISLNPPGNIKKSTKPYRLHSCPQPIHLQFHIWSVRFFDVLRGSKEFEWTKQCNRYLKALKEHLI